MDAGGLIWLGIGAVLSVFYHGRWTLRVAPWLALTALLLFTHRTEPVAGFLLAWVALTISYGVANRGILPLPGPFYAATMALIALESAIPLLLDRVLGPTLPSAGSALVFPLSWVALTFLVARTNPFGTWSSLGYTQHGNLPLMQLASVTGISGIAFLVAWFAAAVAWAWDAGFAWPTAGPGIVAYAAVFGLVQLAGGARLARTRIGTSATVRVAGIPWPTTCLTQADVLRLYDRDLKVTETERLHLREGFTSVLDRFIGDSRREARAGARIIAWPEASAFAFAEDEAELLARITQLAREEDIFLLVGAAILRPLEHGRIENKALLVEPSGAVRWQYVKATAAAGEARVNVRGTKPIPTGDTRYGRLSSPICFDMDFPWIVRVTGRTKADMLLVPASDWPAIAGVHQAMAEFRAVENGAALFRITRWGHSAAIDAVGRRLAFADHSANQSDALVALMPVGAHLPTLYARAGDWFAWVAMATLAGIVVHALVA